MEEGETIKFFLKILLSTLLNNLLFMNKYWYTVLMISKERWLTFQSLLGCCVLGGQKRALSWARFLHLQQSICVCCVYMLTLQERQNFTLALPHCRVSKISPDLRGHTFPCDVEREREGREEKKGGRGELFAAETCNRWNPPQKMTSDITQDNQSEASADVGPQSPHVSVSF